MESEKTEVTRKKLKIESALNNSNNNNNNINNNNNNNNNNNSNEVEESSLVNNIMENLEKKFPFLNFPIVSPEKNLEKLASDKISLFPKEIANPWFFSYNIKQLLRLIEMENDLAGIIDKITKKVILSRSKIFDLSFKGCP
jgi:hypothetical protein